jgi:hypothetical protein
MIIGMIEEEQSEVDAISQLPRRVGRGTTDEGGIQGGMLDGSGSMTGGSIGGGANCQDWGIGQSGDD